MRKRRQDNAYEKPERQLDELPYSFRFESVVDVRPDLDDADFADFYR